MISVVRQRHPNPNGICICYVTELHKSLLKCLKNPVMRLPLFRAQRWVGPGHWRDQTGMQAYHAKLLELKESSCKDRAILPISSALYTKTGCGVLPPQLVAAGENHVQVNDESRAHSSILWVLLLTLSQPDAGKRTMCS